MAALSTTKSSIYGNTIDFEAPYNTSTGSVSPAVPALMDFSIGGRAYKADTNFVPFRAQSFHSESLPPIADKTDITNIPGEASVNTQGLWRRAMDDWSAGAGQPFHDRKASMDNRFRASKGINPWTQWYATLLPDTAAAVGPTSSTTQVLTVGARVYVLDGSTVKFSTNLSSWTTVTGITGTPLCLTTDGYFVYIACGSNGIYISNVTVSSAASWVTGTVNFVWYVGGQLMAATNNLLYNVTLSNTASATALASASTLLMTHPNTQFVWSVACAGNAWIYIGGTTSNNTANVQGLVYCTQENSGGTALTPPVVAATLTGGEQLYCLYAYANFICLGTNLGARLCKTLGVNDPGGSSNAGLLQLGPIVPTLIQQVSKPVKCMVGNFRFIYFGWSNYDTTSTGIGRMDLSTFIDVQAPAYTSDLMVSGAGEVISMDWFNGSPVFVVSGLGLYSQASTLVASGSIDVGIEEYGLPDDKIAVYMDFDAVGQGNVGASISVNDGATTYVVPSQNVSNQLVQLSLPYLRGGRFETTVTLTPNAGLTVGPTLRRYMTKSLPAVVAPSMHYVAMDMHSTIEAGMLQGIRIDPYAEWQYLDNLRKAQTPVLYCEGASFQVMVIVFSIDRGIWTQRGLADGGGFNQKFVVALRSLDN